jgi:hypothetical protein
MQRLGLPVSKIKVILGKKLSPCAVFGNKILRKRMEKTL